MTDTSFTLSTRGDYAYNIDNNYKNTDYYYAFRLRNENPIPVPAFVSIQMSGAIPSIKRSVAVRSLTLTPQSDENVKEWRPLSLDHVDFEASENLTRLSLLVEPQSTLDVTSMYWMSTSQVLKRLDEVASETTRVLSLGQTLQGRLIPLVEIFSFAAPDALLIVVGASPQCHELGTITVMGILEAVLRGELDDVVRNYRLALLPLLNPDGNAMGNCMTNADGQNIMFGFLDADMPAECTAAWEYLSREKPLFYLEMHSYLHLDRPSFRPYEWDLQIYPDEVSRACGKLFIEAVKRFSPGKSVYLEVDSNGDINNRSTLNGRLIRNAGVPATTYKLHNREPVDFNIKHTLQLLKYVCSELRM